MKHSALYIGARYQLYERTHACIVKLKYSLIKPTGNIATSLAFHEKGINFFMKYEGRIVELFESRNTKVILYMRF